MRVIKCLLLIAPLQQYDTYILLLRIIFFPVDPPQVTVHPVDQTNIVPGNEVSFSVTATGTAPLSYQWQKDGVELTDGCSITGATTATLTITGVMESDEGGYRCVVSNSLGMDTSNTAMLTVGNILCKMKTKFKRFISVMPGSFNISNCTITHQPGVIFFLSMYRK